MAAHKPDSEDLRRLVLRSNTSVLHMGVLLFQITSMLLLTFKNQGTLDNQALTFAICMPLCTELVFHLFSRIWPIDRALLLLVIFLMSVGLVSLKSISRYPDTPWEQSSFMLIGFVSMAAGIIFCRSVRSWEKLLPAIIMISVVVICLPLVFGQWKNGAKNWIKLSIAGYSLSVQPSEFVKIALIYVLSAGLSGNVSFRKTLIPLFFAVFMCCVLLAERDLGALLLYFIITLAVYYAATSNLTITTLGIAGGAVASVYAYKTMDIVKKRIAIYRDPWSDPLNDGYQLVQALIAIGSGGLFGSGIGLGAPRNVPLYYSDFIFASIAEQYGLIFSIALIAVYVLLLMRGISIAANARTSFHALLAFSVVVLIGLQTFINIGGNIKLIPMTGITLPFISSGGSSLISMMFSAGLLLGVSSINADDEDDDLARLQIKEAGRV